MSRIPVLDIKRFTSDRDAFITDFSAAYREWGFAGITNHGIDQQQIKSALSAAELFFALPPEQKKRYVLPSGSARGFTPFGVEKAKDAALSDLKEFFHVGRDMPGVAHLSANVWPEEVPEFRSAFEAIYTALDHLATQLLEAVALSLSLPADYFVNKVNRGDTILRVLHYPPIKDTKVPNLRAAAHEDINLITLLAGSEQEGLEVLSRQGEWVPISMIEGTIVCNVGDMLQRLSNTHFPSTTHRVVNPPGNKARVSRYSIPFFMHPNPEMSLDALPQCVDSDHPKLHPAISAGDYLQERLKAIGLIQ